MALCPAEQCNAPAAFLAPTATCRTSTCEVRPPTEQFFFGETRDTALRTTSTRCDVQNLGMMMMSKIRESNLGAKKSMLIKSELPGFVSKCWMRPDCPLHRGSDDRPWGFWGFILFETPPKYICLHPTTPRYIPLIKSHYIPLCTPRYIPLHPIKSHYIPLHPIN